MIEIKGNLELLDNKKGEIILTPCEDGRFTMIVRG